MLAGSCLSSFPFLFFGSNWLGLLRLRLLIAVINKGATDDLLSWLHRWLHQRFILLAWLLRLGERLLSSLPACSIDCLLKSLHIALQLHSNVVNSSIHAVHASMESVSVVAVFLDLCYNRLARCLVGLKCGSSGSRLTRLIE